MAIKDTLKSIADKLPEEMASERALIAGVIREVDNVLDDLKETTAESVRRKGEIRQLKAQIEEKYVAYFLANDKVLAFEVFANCYENAREMACKISDGRYCAFMVEHVGQIKD